MLKFQFQKLPIPRSVVYYFSVESLSSSSEKQKRILVGAIVGFSAAK